MILGLCLLGGIVVFAQDNSNKKAKTSCCSSSDKNSDSKSKCSSNAKTTEEGKIDYIKVNETIEEVVNIDKDKDVYYNIPNNISIQKVETTTNKK